MLKAPRRRKAAAVYYVYILECADRSYYTGYSLDLKRRLDLHQKGYGSAYVYSRRPFRLIYHEKYPTQRAAMQRECEIKGLSRAQKEAVVKSRRRCPAASR